jgi:hypothetical protein
MAAVAAGKGVDIVDDPTWLSMTAAQFAAYDAIILGDPNCVEGTGPVAAAESNALVWGPVLTGNVVVIGTDPTYHTFHGTAGAQQLINSAVAFSVAASGRTGGYLCLSCYYNGIVSNTAVPMLAGVSTAGTFTVTGVPGCFNDAHIVASSPALTGLTDADLSNWSCSVHEAFDHRPTDFIALAIARDPIGGPPLPGSEPFPDGSSGVPYILARGEIAPVGFVLAPFTATNPTGTTHTVTATIDQEGVPAVGVTVTFTVTGVNPTTGTGVTNTSGVATFTYPGVHPGTDTIVATYTDAAGHTFTSNTVQKIWTPGNNPTPTPTATPRELEAHITVSPKSVWNGQKATFTLAVDGVAKQPITMRYSMSGNAIQGSNYTLSGTLGQVTIPTGSSSAKVILRARKNQKKTATMNLHDGAGYFVLHLPFHETATVKIKKK